MRKLLLSMFVVMLLAMAISLTSTTSTKSAAAADASRETQPVYTTPDGFLLGPAVPDAFATLVRNNNGLTTNVHTYGSGNGAGVYSLWWVVFNHPASCATYLCTYDEPDFVVNAAAHNVPTGAFANLSGRLNPGGPYAGEIIYEGPDPDLTNPGGALIVLVVRYHGPAIPDALSEQFNNYLGGCPSGGPPCQDAQLVVFPGECSGDCLDPSKL